MKKDINELWHELDEKPKVGKYICVHLENGGITTWRYAGNADEAMTKFNVQRWAYLHDLLPEEGGDK